MKRSSNRRQFLKNSALAGAGVWLGTSVNEAQSRSPNEKLNLGMIGVGGKGETALLAFASQNIVAMCDVDSERAARAFRLRTKATKYHDYRKMLEERKDLDAVVISTPDHHHAPAAVMAMNLGKHVYCEKPLSQSIYEARVMRETARRCKVATQMGNQGHAGANLRRAVELVQAGAIGQVRQFHAWTNRPSWPQGIDRPTETMPVPAHLKYDLWLGPAPERPYNDAYLPFKWRGWWDFGSGALGDMACHVADLGYWALELGAPTTVEAEVSDVHPETAPKWSIIRYEFPARGELPPVKFTWYDGGKKPDSALVDGKPLPDNGSLLVGDEGKLFVPDTYGGRYQLLPEEKFADYEGPEPTIPRTRSHYGEWLRACMGGPPAMSNFDYAGPLTEVVLLGTIAIRAGKRIEWNEAEMKVANCPEAEEWLRREYRTGWAL